MAVAVIGGLITSTLLSLLVVPAVFTYVDDIEHWFGRMGRRLRHRPVETVPRKRDTVK
jgi:predicted RND superfamily exporter protein